MKVSKREVWFTIAGAVLGVFLAWGYASYFGWWDISNCEQSGGTWNESRNECIEPPGADIPGTTGPSR